MSRVFTAEELAFLAPAGRRLGRIATVGRDGMPHVTPTGWSYNAEHDTIDVGGASLATTKKYRDAHRSGVAAIVIDDVLPPWRPRGVEIRGRVEVMESLMRIHPVRVISWGLPDGDMGQRHARNVLESGRRDGMAKTSSNWDPEGLSRPADRLDGTVPEENS